MKDTTLTTVVFLFPYAIVDSTFAKISIMLPNPSNVAIPKAVNIIQKTTVEKTVFLLLISCLENIIFRTHPTMFSTDPEKAPRRKYCKINRPSFTVRLREYRVL